MRPSNRRPAAVRAEGDDQVTGPFTFRDEIASLDPNQPRLDSLNTRQPTQGADTSARDMEELADYFSQRLANCQRQVYNVVNQVNSHVGDGNQVTFSNK